MDGGGVFQRKFVHCMLSKRGNHFVYVVEALPVKKGSECGFQKDRRLVCEFVCTRYSCRRVCLRKEDYEYAP